jgi:hypothetical protein
MTFLKRINTNISPFIKNGIFRYFHHHSLINIPRPKIIINLLGDFEYVDIASWEIYTFAQDKKLPSANIVYHDKMIKDILYNNYLQFIVNRCYNISCNNLFVLNQQIMYSETNWKQYNLYVIPNATNRFTTCNFIKNCDKEKIIIYPLEAPEENKRRDINILIG